MKNKVAALTLLTVATMLLTGCDEKTPSDQLTSSVVRSYADFDGPDVEVVDWERDNGWTDTSAPNQYIVRYKYNWALKKPMFDVALEGAQQALAEYKKQPGLQQTVLAMAATQAANAWVAAQGEAVAKSRYQTMMRACPSCLQWIDAKDAKEEPRLGLFMAAWSDLEDKGFADAAPVGTKVPRTAWASFKKTEKGWEKV